MTSHRRATDTPSNKLSACLELVRLSNLPTVVTNVLVGLTMAFLSAFYAENAFDRPATELQQLWRMLSSFGAPAGGLLVLVAAICFYMLGMALNDLADVEIDRKERPERPIPSGRISQNQATALIALLAAIGAAALLLTGSPAVIGWGTALLVAIVAYDLLHKRFAGAVVIMGGCRSLLYMTAAALSPIVHEPAWWRIVTPLALLIGLYTIAITLVARQENEPSPGRRRWAALMMPVVVLPAVLAVQPYGMHMLYAAIAALVLLLWFSRAARFMFAQPPGTKQAILTWLSGMCLVDAYFLTLMARPITALIAAVGFLLTVLAHRRIAGT